MYATDEIIMAIFLIDLDFNSYLESLERKAARDAPSLKQLDPARAKLRFRSRGIRDLRAIAVFDAAFDLINESINRDASYARIRLRYSIRIARALRASRLAITALSPLTIKVTDDNNSRYVAR